MSRIGLQCDKKGKTETLILKFVISYCLIKI